MRSSIKCGKASDGSGVGREGNKTNLLCLLERGKPEATSDKAHYRTCRAERLLRPGGVNQRPRSARKEGWKLRAQPHHLPDDGLEVFKPNAP
jgi:hypothetical protein